MSELLDMDIRDTVIWKLEAGRKFAQRKLDLIQAACAPHLDNYDLSELVSQLSEIVRRDFAQTQQANQEAEWAAARAELLVLVGRKS